MSSEFARSTEGQVEPEEFTLSEIRSRFNDKWVAILVTKRDKNLQPIKGSVVESNLDRYMLRQKLRLKSKEFPEVCILFAGEPVYPLLL